MTKIILERHGQSLGNKNRIFLGHTDLSLTDEGREQARISAEFLKDEKLCAIYSSDLKRAYETALPHAELHSLNIIKREALRELFVGDFEGLPMERLKTEFYEDFVVRRSHRDFVFPGGEGVFEAAERFRREILKIAKECEGKCALVVSHAAIIRAFWFFLSGSDAQNMDDAFKMMENGAFCTLEYKNGALLPHEYNLSEHLPPTDIHPV